LTWTPSTLANEEFWKFCNLRSRKDRRVHLHVSKAKKKKSVGDTEGHSTAVSWCRCLLSYLPPSLLLHSPFSPLLGAHLACPPFPAWLLWAEYSAAASGVMERLGDCLPWRHSTFTFPFPFSPGPAARYENNSALGLHRASHPGNLKMLSPASLITLIFSGGGNCLF
jgi:hypothetical protein